MEAASTKSANAPVTTAQQLVPCDDHILEIFLNLIADQADFGLLAAADIEAATKGGDIIRVWYSVQAFLGAVANVSKLIWPAYSKRHNDQRLSDREQRLRELLDSESCAVLKDKDFRNAFEHFDARIEEWAVTVEGRPFIDGNINAHLTLRDIPQERWLRNLDTSTWIITFRGKGYSMLPVVDALLALRQKARVAALDLAQKQRVSAQTEQSA